MTLSTTEHRFHVHGRRVAISRRDGAWIVLTLGADGKRSPAGWVVPDFVAEDELAQYLDDLFHESATPHSGGVYRLD